MYQKEVLSNNLRFIKVPMLSVESVTVQIFVRVGGRDETKEKMGLSHFLEHTVFKGTRKRPSAKKISEEIERVGGVYNAATGTEYTMFYVKVPREKIEVAFDVLSDVLLNSVFKKEALEKERQVIIEEINVYEDMPMVKVESVFSGLLFPDHALGYDLTGIKETVGKLAREDVLDYLGRHYLAQNMVLSVAGNFKPEKVDKMARHYFGAVRKGTIPGVLRFVDRQKSPQLKVFFKKTDQTHLCLGFKTFGYQDKERFKLRVLSAVLGQGASSRLFERLREREGLCYYVSSDADLFLETGVFYVKAGVDNHRVEKAIKLILKELLKIRNSRMTQKELKRAKEYLKGTLKLSLESSDAQGSFYATQELLFSRVLTSDQIAQKIDEVTSDDLLDLTKRVIVEEKLNLALVGPFEREETFKKLLRLT